MKKLIAIFSMTVLLFISCSQNQLKEFKRLPEGMDPVTVGNKLAAQLLSTDPCAYMPIGYSAAKPMSKDFFFYAVVSLWTNSLEFARNSGNKELENQLIELFEPYFGEKKFCCNPANHVDLTVFGALPLEIYVLNSDQRAFELGIAYADRQWAAPDSLDLGGNGNFSYAKQLELHEEGYSPQTRLWIDDMYMINILQTQAFRATGDIKYVERAAKEMVLYLDTLQNPDGLFFHSADAPFVWGRGDGWMAAGMPMILKYLPEDNEYYPRILEGYKKMMSSLLANQHESGLWGQLVTDADSWDESSCSAMFTYAFIQGIKSGWLDASEYGPAARKAWIALCSKLDEYGNIPDVCIGTNRKNDHDYYLARPRETGDPHGQAPMMWICNALVEQ